MSASELALAAAAHEVHSLSESGARLEKLVARLTRDGALDAESIIQAQSIDLLAQTLQELAAFMRSVSADYDADAQSVLLRALSRVRLGALAQRLEAFCAGEPGDGAQGEGVELF